MPGPREEAAAAAVAAGQHGMITTAQLSAAGFGPNAVARRVAGGWLIRRGRGIYQLGVFGGRFGDEMAALLLLGPQAVLGRWAAVAAFDLAARAGRPVDVFVPRAAPRARGSVRPHQMTDLAPGDVVVRHGMRVTTPARTMLDLAAVAPSKVLERLVEEVQVQRLASHAELMAVVERAGGRPGVPKLRTIVSRLDEPSFTRSEAERRLLDVVRAAGLARPQTNVRVAGLEVDALWRAQRLVVEVDGYAFHGTRAAFERDRRRDAQLLVAGYRVIRITWRQLTREPRRVARLIAIALRIGPNEVPAWEEVRRVRP